MEPGAEAPLGATWDGSGVSFALFSEHATAVELASVPEHIRGYGHVKEAHLRTAKTREAALLAAFRSPETAPKPTVVRIAA